MKKSKENIVEGFDNLIKGKLLSDQKISEKSLITLEVCHFKKSPQKKSNLKTRIKASNFNPILKEIDIRSCLEAVQKRYVLVPIHKASNNVAIICKRYYFEMMLIEIGVIGRRNNTYCKGNKSCDEIIYENTEYIKRLNFKIIEKEKAQPITHWIFTIDNNTTGARFNIASKICSTKQISKSVSNVFKLIYSQIELIYSQIYSPAFIKILNSYQIIILGLTKF